VRNQSGDTVALLLIIGDAPQLKN